MIYRTEKELGQYLLTNSSWSYMLQKSDQS